MKFGAWLRQPTLAAFLLLWNPKAGDPLLVLLLALRLLSLEALAALLRLAVSRLRGFVELVQALRLSALGAALSGRVLIIHDERS
jgi:hypothetical protein